MILPRYPATPVCNMSLLPGKYMVEEKLDGANCGIYFDGTNFNVRSRDHYLYKAHRGGGAAKKQFIPLWEYLSRYKKKFKTLNRLCGECVLVYAEWLWFVHGRVYESLPTPFIPFSLYSIEKQEFIDPFFSRNALIESDFVVTPLIGISTDTEWIRSQSDGISGFTGEREGIVIKSGNGIKQTFCQKIISHSYIQNSLWCNDNPIRQQIQKA